MTFRILWRIFLYRLIIFGISYIGSHTDKIDTALAKAKNNPVKQLNHYQPEAGRFGDGCKPVLMRF